MAMQNGVKLSQTSPSFLHANSTSHTWIFSAFAEIIDNAYDPDVSASELYIDKKSIHAKDCLVFTDNGNGMTPEKLHKMLSFGYCEKVEVNGHKPIGHYGNGFKSGSMRIGKDAIVFTKDSRSMSVGFLSQTYLRNIGAKTVLVPIVTYDRHTMTVKEAMDAKGSLQAITRHSIFNSSTELLLEFQALEQFQTGTRIIIYNLNRGGDNKFELDFTSSQHDIINSEHQVLDMSATYRPVKEYQSEYRRSLREYCSILFLKPRMKIILRGKKVKTKLISQSLSRTEKDVYKPLGLNKGVKITFGFSNNKYDYGIMMYHRNRLIKAYERVGYQKQANELGVGVVGVVSVNFLEPIHNKQDFNKTDRYNATMNALSTKLNDYWNEKNNVIDIEADEVIPKNEELPPDWTWAQCDNCLKWRRQPLGTHESALPEKWFCYMNPDPIHNRCDVEEEPEDEDELMNRASYEKTFKKFQEKGKQQTLKRKEQKLLIQEKELRLMRTQLETMQQSQEVSSSEDIKPSVDELVKALEDARRREEEQKALIERLQQDKEAVLDKELSQVVAEGTTSLAFSDKDKQSQQPANNNNNNKQTPQEAPSKSGTRKRGSLPADVPGKRVCMRNAEEQFIVTANVSDDEDLIVLGSDDEDESSSAPKKNSSNAPDIKPDVNLLNQQIEAQKEKASNETPPSQNGIDDSQAHLEASPPPPAGSTPDEQTSLSPKRTPPPATKSTPNPAMPRRSPVPSTSSDNRKSNMAAATRTPPNTRRPMTVKFPFKKPDSLPSPPSVRSPPHPGRPQAKTHNRAVQTLKMEDVIESESSKKLKDLRLHVSQLLAIIAPDVDLGNLDNIDEIVTEMIRVNSSQTDDETDDESS